MPQTRWRAAALHLIASAILALLVSLLVIGVWYPGPLASASGLYRILALALLVDLIVGPTLTAVVYDLSKPELKRDLAIIIAIQAIALGLALTALATARPAYLVFNGNRFDLVYANDLDEASRAQAGEPFKNPPWFGPRWIGVKRPTDEAKDRSLLEQALSGGTDIQYLPEYYVEGEAVREQMLQSARTVNSFIERRPTAEPVLRNYRELLYVPLKTPHKDLTVILAPGTAEVRAVVDVSPW